MTLVVAALGAGSVLVLLAPTRAVPRRCSTLVAGAAAAGPSRAVLSRAQLSRARRLGVRVEGAVGRQLRGVARRPFDPALDRRTGRAAMVGMVALPVAAWLAPVAAVVVWVWPAWVSRRARRRQAASLRSAVPDVIELFRLAVGAGLTVNLAVHAVTPRLPPSARPLLAEVVERVAVGERLADGLDGLARRAEVLRPLAVALASGERYGGALGPTLERLALEARLDRRRQAEEAARRLPVQLLFPLVACVLPAFALLTVIPLGLASLGRLAW